MSETTVSPAGREATTTTGPIIVVSGPGGVGKSTIARLVAAAFHRSVHLKSDDLMASVVSGWVDPSLAAAEQQNEAIGGALAASAMAFAHDGYTTVVDGHLFPEGVAGLAAAAERRGLACHYAVLATGIDTCWERATARGEGRWPLELGPFRELHARFSQLDLDDRHVIDATGPAGTVSETLLAAFRTGRLAVSPRSG